MEIDAKLGVCHCGPGFEPTDDGTCVDVDECSIENNCPDSSQGIQGHTYWFVRVHVMVHGSLTSICVNQYGAYACSCKEGYNLDADFKDCKE